MARFSATVRNGKTSRPSGTWLSPSLTMRSGSMPWIGLPSSSIVPFCGSSTPEMVLRMVVLPAPLAPSTVTISPCGTSRLTPRTAMMRP